MAKELPYFRFTASEWLNDNISMESYQLKGLFIDVCAFYWFKDCSIDIALLNKRFSDAINDLHELRELEIIKYNDDDSITIKFLDEQYDLLSEKRKKRSEAGRVGGLKKSSNAKAMLKQNPSYKDKDKDNYNDKEKDNINKIYSAYPSKCPIQNRSTSKGSKDKEKIKSMLKSMSSDELELTIKTYIAECIKSKTYVKNFSSFLNNLPDYKDIDIKEDHTPAKFDRKKVNDIWN